MNKKVEAVIKETRNLIRKAVKVRDKLTKEEIEDLRVELGEIRARLVFDVMGSANSAKISAELKKDNLEGSEFNRYFKGYSGKEYTDASGVTKKYTASVAESVSRKALHSKGTPYYKAKKEFLEAKAFLDQLHQILKSIDQLSNGLSSITKSQN